MNPTIKKFGHPKTLIREYKHWVVLVRPAQVTIGSVVIACKEDALSLGGVSQSAWTEFESVSKETEAALKTAFNFDKLNYLALMMVDKQVHFHLIPRYRSKRTFHRRVWIDSDWPNKTELATTHKLTDNEITMMVKKIQAAWRQAKGSTAMKLYSDGGSRGNPGHSAIAYVICNVDDNVVEKTGKYIGVGTNNQAEYKALLAGLKRVKTLGSSNLEVYLDSELVVKQINGQYKIKNNELLPIFKQIKLLSADFESIKFIHVPRALNKEADGEVNRILDDQKL